MENTSLEFSEKGKKAFELGDFEAAIQAFSEAANAYAEEGKELDAAEERNNLSVAFLQVEKAEESLEAANGTELIFAEANDPLRQAMALGNQAAALGELGNPDEAIALYQKSAALFGEVGEGDYQETVLKSIAALELRSGKLQDTAQTMLQSLGAVARFANRYCRGADTGPRMPRQTPPRRQRLEVSMPFDRRFPGCEYASLALCRDLTPKRSVAAVPRSIPHNPSEK